MKKTVSELIKELVLFCSEVLENKDTKTYCEEVLNNFNSLKKFVKISKRKKLIKGYLSLYNQHKDLILKEDFTWLKKKLVVEDEFYSFELGEVYDQCKTDENQLIYLNVLLLNIFNKCVNNEVLNNLCSEYEEKEQEEEENTGVDFGDMIKNMGSKFDANDPFSSIGDIFKSIGQNKELTKIISNVTKNAQNHE